MKRVCSYCGADMGTKPGKEGDVTHGICPACYQKEMDKMDILESEKRKAGAAEGAKHYGSAKNAGKDKTIDEISVEITGKKYRELPDDGPEQEHVMHEYERITGKKSPFAT